MFLTSLYIIILANTIACYPSTLKLRTEVETLHILNVRKIHFLFTFARLQQNVFLYSSYCRCCLFSLEYSTQTSLLYTHCYILQLSIWNWNNYLYTQKKTILVITIELLPNTISFSRSFFNNIKFNESLYLVVIF